MRAQTTRPLRQTIFQHVRYSRESVASRSCDRTSRVVFKRSRFRTELCVSVVIDVSNHLTGIRGEVSPIWGKPSPIVGDGVTNDGPQADIWGDRSPSR